MNINERKALSIVLNETANNLFSINDEITSKNINYESLLIELVSNKTLNEIISTIQEKNQYGFVTSTFMLMADTEKVLQIVKILNKLGFLAMISTLDDETALMSVDWCEFSPKLTREIHQNLENNYSVRIHEPMSYFTPMIRSLREKNPLYSVLSEYLALPASNDGEEFDGEEFDGDEFDGEEFDGEEFDGEEFDDEEFDGDL